MLTRLHHQLNGGRCNLVVAALLLLLAGCGGGGGAQSANSPNFASSSSTTVTPPNVAGWSQFVYPVSGQLGVTAGQAFQWTEVSGAQAYQLQVGTTVGGSDVFDSGPIAATSISVPKLPAAQTLYARVRAIPTGWSTTINGPNFPRASYATFRTDANVTGATFASPAPGTVLDADTPVVWQSEPLAQGYRLTLGSTMGAADLLDSGTIHTPQRLVSGLGGGAAVYATLYTYYAQNITRSHSASFIAGNASPTNAAMLAVARNLAAQVRNMADIDNQPYDDTLLRAITAAQNDAVADCGAFTATLLSVLAEAGVPLQSRQLKVCLNTNSYDCHALVELFDPDTQRWITVDPTFGLYALNAQAQAATSAEISAAARTQTFGQLSFVYLTSAGDGYARTYYIDYPLLFLNVYQPGSDTELMEPAPASLTPYFDPLGAGVNGAASGAYAAQCADGYSSSTADWDGVRQTYTCTSGFTPIFYGFAVSTLQGDPSTAGIWRTHRFVF
jgi:hypothetical protein